MVRRPLSDNFAGGIERKRQQIELKTNSCDKIVTLLEKLDSTIRTLVGSSENRQSSRSNNGAHLRTKPLLKRRRFGWGFCILLWTEPSYKTVPNCNPPKQGCQFAALGNGKNPRNILGKHCGMTPSTQLIWQSWGTKNDSKSCLFLVLIFTNLFT